MYPFRRRARVPGSARRAGLVLAALAAGGPLGAGDSPRPGQPAAPPAARLTFPTPAPMELAPAPLDRDAGEVPLPGTVTDAAVGGGGRYWCLLLADRKQVAVFDANRAQVVKLIPLAAGDVRIAAGMTKLLVVYPHLPVIVRYDLRTGAKEATALLPTRGTVQQVCLGAASAGPLLVYGGAKYDFVTTPVTFLDIQTLKELRPGESGGRLRPGSDPATHFRASPDGRLYGAWTTSVSPTGLYGLTADEDGLKTHHEHTSAGSVVPSADGHLVTQSGLFTPDLKPVGGGDREKERLKHGTSGVRVPAQQGDWYLLAEAEKDDKFNPLASDSKPRATKVSVHRTADPRAIMSLGDIGLTVGSDAWTASDFTQDKRVLFSPANGLIAWVAPDNRGLRLRRFDARAELDRTKADYLLVTGTAPGVDPDKLYRYPLAVLSKRGGVLFRLAAGPDGAKVTADGTLLWTPPKGWAGGDAVVVVVSDASGQEVRHAFTLRKAVSPAREDPPAAVRPPAAPPEPPAGRARGPANPAKLTPTKAADGAEVKLPGVVDATCLGGNGRYVLLRIPKLKLVAVLDVCEGKVVKYVPVPEEAALFAAGNEHLYVVASKTNTIERWNLRTFAKEPPVANPFAAPRAALVGHASDGPLFLIGAGTEAVGRLDGGTLEKLDPPGGWKDFRWDGAERARVSADGRVLGHWSAGHTPTGLRSLVLSDAGGAAYDEHESVGSVLPGPDGTLFTGRGLYTPDLRPVPDTRGPWEALPPAHGRVYLAVSGPTRENEKAETKLTLRLIGESRAVAELGNLRGLDLPAPDPFARPHALPVADRVFLVPDAHALVALNGTADRVYIHKVEVGALLDRAGFDYLFVASRPGAARRGAAFAYKPDVTSKKGGVAMTLALGPEGMGVTADGTLTWNVPADFAADAVPVLLTISDASGQEVFHAFTLPVLPRS